MSKKILLVEDDGATLSIVEALDEIYGYDLYKTTNNWSYVSSWLERKPGIRNFHALVFDLKVSAYKLKIYSEKSYNEENDLSPSLYFVEHFIVPNYPEMKERVILTSGFSDEMQMNYEHKTGRLLTDDYMFIDKLESRSFSKLVEMLDTLD
ncbi:MAG: hypothetical protein FWC41_05560 [Firmicutes bacterium]|nr:hypothetical protein [Bacillota bacterium]